MAKVTRTSFCYRIVRFFRVSGRRKIIAVGLTRSAAMEHCSRPDTRRAGVWFDGFEVMPGYEDYTEGGVLPGAGDPVAGAPDPNNDWINGPAVMGYNPDPVAGDDVPVPGCLPLSDTAVIPLPVPVAGAPDPAVIYARWVPLVMSVYDPAMPEDEGGYWD